MNDLIECGDDVGAALRGRSRGMAPCTSSCNGSVQDTTIIQASSVVSELQPASIDALPFAQGDFGGIHIHSPRSVFEDNTLLTSHVNGRERVGIAQTLEVTVNLPPVPPFPFTDTDDVHSLASTYAAEPSLVDCLARERGACCWL